MRLVLLKLFILVTLTPCFSQGISDAELDSLKLFWTRDRDTVIKPTFRKFNFENKLVVFFGTDHSVKDASDPMYIQMEKEINNLNPTLILTEGYSVLLDNKLETTENYGDVGFCSYSGFERGIRVQSWDMPYNDLYYLLRMEFSENELYALMIIVELWRSGGVDQDFSDLISAYEVRGWPLKPEQKTKAFFLKQYKRYFNIPVEITSNNTFRIPLDKLVNTPRLKKYYSILQRLRDEHLIKTLKESLRLNDRIFIQAGALHLISLEKIIPFILKDSKLLEKEERNTSTNFFPDTNFSKSFSIEKISNGEKRIILFGSNYNVNSDDPQFAAIKKEIANVKPDLILTQGFDPLYVSEKQTISESGVVGFCRLLGISKGVRVNSWDPSWDEVYYTLNRKYKAEDIYFSLLCWSILRSHNIKDNSIEDLAVKTLTAFGTFGYPLTLNLDEEFDFLNTVAEYLGQQEIVTFGTPIPALSNPDDADIELNTDGSYKFGGRKPGIYNYKVPLRTITGVKEYSMVPLKLIIPDSSYFVEISGSLPNPSTYISGEDIKEILQKCIKQNIVNDLHLIRAAHLLKQAEGYKKQYNRIFIQADREYINFIKAELEKTIGTSRK